MIFLRSYTIFQHEKALLFQKGVIDRELPPGTYRLRRHQNYLRFDMRSQTEAIGSQEASTSDGATIRLSLYATYRIADIHKVFQSIAIDPRLEGAAMASIRVAIHLPIQVAIRNWLSSLTLQQAMEKRKELEGEVFAVAKPGFSDIGIELVGVRLLDFNVAGTLRSAQADILKAELEGQAAIQRARNEASTMRSLINTARLTREHPGLLELRILASGQKPRVTFQISASDSSSIRDKDPLPEESS